MTDQFADHTGPPEMQSFGPPPYVQQPSGSASGYAIAAFVLGIAAFITCGPCAGIPALILGLIELRNIKNRVSPVEGKPFALVGAILGGVNTALLVLAILFYAAFIVFFIMAGFPEFD